MDNKREVWADVAKGIAILAIVFGHSGETKVTEYLYWFHVPAFFVLSGYFHKTISNGREFRSLTLKRFYQLIVPYITLILIITCVRYSVIVICGGKNTIWYIKDFIKTVLIPGSTDKTYGTLWFLTCLFFTQIIFALIELCTRKKKFQLFFIIFFYALAHVQTMVFGNKQLLIPLGIDKTLLCISYFSFGYYCRDFIKNSKLGTLILVSFLAIILITLSIFNLFEFDFDIAANHYNNIFIDFIVPVILTMTLCTISKTISDIGLGRVLAFIGVNSLTIMYFHKNVNYIFRSFLSYNYVIYVVLGVTVPLIISWLIIERFSFTQFLFKGRKTTKEIAVSMNV